MEVVSAELSGILAVEVVSIELSGAPAGKVTSSAKVYVLPAALTDKIIRNAAVIILKFLNLIPHQRAAVSRYKAVKKSRAVLHKTDSTSGTGLKVLIYRGPVLAVIKSVNIADRLRR